MAVWGCSLLGVNWIPRGTLAQTVTMPWHAALAGSVWAGPTVPAAQSPSALSPHKDHRGLPPKNQLGRQKFRPKTLLLASLYFQKKGNPPPQDRAFLPVSMPGSLLAE